MLDWPLERKRFKSEKCFQPAAFGLNLSFLSINKNGTTTAQVNIRQMHKLAAVNWIDHPVKYPDHKIVCMWRDPYKRVESTYRWAQVAYGDFKNFVMPDARSQSFARWVEELCSVDTPKDWYDSHLQAQCFLGASEEGKLADIILPWDWPRLWHMFKIHSPGEIRNQSDKSIETMWTVPALKAFERVYEDDLSIWEGLKHGT